MWREFHLILSKNTHARADKRELTSTRKNFFVFVNFCLLLYCLSSTYFVLGLADRGSYFQTFIQWPLVITLYIVSTSKKIKRKKMKWEIKRKSALSRPSCFMSGIKYSDQIEIIFCGTTSIMFKLINWSNWGHEELQSVNNFYYLVKSSRALSTFFGNISFRHEEELSTHRDVQESPKLSRSKVSIPREQVLISSATGSIPKLTSGMTIRSFLNWGHIRVSEDSLECLNGWDTIQKH